MQLLLLLLLLCLYHVQGVEWFGQCVKNIGNEISLPKFMWTRSSNKAETCIQACKDKGYAFAGVQALSKCFCGNDPPLSSNILSLTDCYYFCAEDTEQRCGGVGNANVYPTTSEINIYDVTSSRYEMGRAVC